MNRVPWMGSIVRRRIQHPTKPEKILQVRILGFCKHEQFFGCNSIFYDQVTGEVTGIEETITSDGENLTRMRVKDKRGEKWFPFKPNQTLETFDVCLCFSKKSKFSM